MIDRLLSFDEIESSTDFVIKEDNIFCKDGLFLETGIMENIAQTCAARIGYININNNESVKIGVIGSIKDLIITKLPKVGTTLVTKVKVLSEVFAALKFTTLCLEIDKFFCGGIISAVVVSWPRG